MMLKEILLLLCLFGWSFQELPAQNEPPDEQRVLIFTKTTEYRHGSISKGVSLIRKLGREHDFKVDRTESAEKFSPENLSRYDLVIFLSTTGDVLNDVQQNAFEKYIEQKGNFMGIHAAVDTEYDWPWYRLLVGARFESHPKVQKAMINVKNKIHPATSFLPDPWERTDEWYNFEEVKKDLNILLTLDESSYKGGKHGDLHPLAWCQEIGGSRSFYTGGGHTDESFSEPLFSEHILKGILWCLGRSDIELVRSMKP